MSTNTDSREVSRAFGRRECPDPRCVDGWILGPERHYPRNPELPVQFVSSRSGVECTICKRRREELARLDECQRTYSRHILIAALVPLTVAGLALAWVMWRMLSGRWGL